MRWATTYGSTNRKYAVLSYFHKSVLVAQMHTVCKNSNGCMYTYVYSTCVRCTKVLSYNVRVCSCILELTFSRTFPRQNFSARRSLLRFTSITRGRPHFSNRSFLEHYYIRKNSCSTAIINEIWYRWSFRSASLPPYWNAARGRSGWTQTKQVPNSSVFFL